MVTTTHPPTHCLTAMTLHTDKRATLPGSGTTASLESQCINDNAGKLFFNESHCEMFCIALFSGGGGLWALRNLSPPPTMFLALMIPASRKKLYLGQLGVFPWLILSTAIWDRGPYLSLFHLLYHIQENNSLHIQQDSEPTLEENCNWEVLPSFCPSYTQAQRLSSLYMLALHLVRWALHSLEDDFY